jgi:O-glycosyl hydrolase
MGLGVSEAFGQATTAMADETTVMNDLFSPTSGAGINILRNEIPSEAGETIEPTAPSSPSATPTYTALGTDNEQEPFTAAAKAAGVDTVIADAWSAPAFMKTNDSIDNGGQVCGVTGATCSSGDWRQAFANYIVQYLKDHSADGVAVNYVGFENEPDYDATYASMTMSAAQSVNMADILGPTLASSGLSTKMTCCATEGWSNAASYGAAIDADTTANADTALITGHGYTAAPTSKISVTQPVWLSEWSTFDTWDAAWNDGTDASGLTWAENLYNAFTEGNVSAFCYWWGTSTTSDNGDNESLLQVNGSTVTPSARLYALGQFGRYVRNGATRIGATTTNSALDVVAFKNSSGSTALVVINTSSSAQNITVGTSGITGSGAIGYTTSSSGDWAAGSSTPLSGGQFSSTVPADAVTTYVIS